MDPPLVKLLLLASMCQPRELCPLELYSWTSVRHAVFSVTLIGSLTRLTYHNNSYGGKGNYEYIERSRLENVVYIRGLCDILILLFTFYILSGG